MLCSSGASAKSNITLKDGQVTTTFGYSLSKSLMNMAYLIMERGVTLLGKPRTIFWVSLVINI